MSLDKPKRVILPKPFEKVMVFIDGGYLRETCKKLYGSDNIEFGYLTLKFIDFFNDYPYNPFQADLIRIYYYDAIADNRYKNYESQRVYFESIEDESKYTVRLGEIIESSKGFKQKGVDILMSIDAITKAYTDQYSTGIFFMGDRDFVPLIRAVKEAGKKTLGVFCETNSAKELIRTFDMRVYLGEITLKSLLKK
jgi:uncharacterized LabA/DUF88 family protein